MGLMKRKTRTLNVCSSMVRTGTLGIADGADATVLVVYPTQAAFGAEGTTVEQKDTNLRPHSSSIAGDNSQKKG